MCLTRIFANLFSSRFVRVICLLFANSESMSLDMLKKTCLVLSWSVNSSDFGRCSVRTFLAKFSSSCCSSGREYSGGIM